MNRVSYYIYKIKEKIFVKIKKSKTFNNSYGLKNINMSMRIVLPETEGREIKEIPFDKLFLGYDYLKDEFTLLDIPITESPHFDMMKKLYMGEDISDCDYIKRWIKGTLDWRYGFIRPKNYDFFVQRFNLSKENVERNEIKPVLVYNLNEKYYIYDGKHRAAMCAYNQMTVPCIVIDIEYMFSGIWDEMFKKILNKKDYKRHTEFYKRYAS